MDERLPRISGRCTDDDGRPVAHLKLMGFLRRTGAPELALGTSVSGLDGRYEIPVEADVAGKDRSGGCVVVRAILDDGSSTESGVAVDLGALLVDVVVDIRLPGQKRTDSAHLARRVRGVIRDERDRALDDVTVRALDRDIRSETLLGAAPAVDGRFEIRYFPQRIGRGFDDEFNLVLEIVEHAGRVLHRTPVQFDIPADFTYDVSMRSSVYGGPSEWQGRSNRLHELLKEVPVEDVRESEDFGEISFLANVTGWTAHDVAAMVECFRLSTRTAVMGDRVPPEVFYGLLRSGRVSLYPATILADFGSEERLANLDERVLKQVVDLGRVEQRRLLDWALYDNVIPATVAPFDQALDALAATRRRLTADQSLGSGDHTIADLLALTPSAQPHVPELLDAIGANAGGPHRLCERLEQRDGIPSDVARDVRRTVELAAPARNHLPMVAALTARLHNGEVSSPREFAKMSREDWVALIQRNDQGLPRVGIPAGVDGESDDERAAAYAARLDWHFERKYPTTSLAAKLNRALGGDRAIPRASQAVANFLSDSPDLHLDRHRLDHYLVEHPDARSRLDGDPGLKSDLLAVQRVFRLHPTFDATDALLSAGLESAQGIYELGAEQLVRRLTDGSVNALDAQQIFRRAETSYASTLALFGEYNAALNGLAPAAVPGLQVDAQARRSIEELPTLQTLFGSEDYCECAHCESVYSPAAYFVDLLRFLDLRATGVRSNTSCKQVLFERRPDLGRIELSCANAETPLPYLDLVIERLEEAVDFGDRVTITVPTEALAPGRVSDALRAALAERDFPVDDTAEVEKSVLGHWIVRSSRVGLDLFEQSHGSPETYLEVSDRGQTLGSAEDLRAAPEHLDAAAYSGMLDSVYPMELPFNVWDREARGYHQHLQVSQADLLHLFDAAAADDWDSLGPSAVLAELGILESTLHQPNSERSPAWYWGLSEASNEVAHPDFPFDSSHDLRGSWIEVLSSVSLVLSRAELTYPELRQLLTMRFVNPDGAIVIAENPSCDTSTARVDGWTAGALTRANGFIRLWRATGRPMWELDWVLYDHAETPDHVPAQSLKLAADTARLSARTGLDWQQISVFFRGFRGVSYVDVADGDKPIPSTYEKTFRRDTASAAVFPANPGDFRATYGQCAAALMAALRVSEAQLAALYRAIGHGTADADVHVILFEVYEMFVLTTIAQAAHLPVEEVGQLVALDDGDFPRDPATATAMLDTVAQLRTLGFSVPELWWLLRSDGPAPLPAIDAAEVIATLQRASAGLSATPPSRADESSLAERQLVDVQKHLLIAEVLAASLGLSGPATAALLDDSRERPPIGGVLASAMDAPQTLSPQESDDRLAEVNVAVRRIVKAGFVAKKLGLTARDVAWWLSDDHSELMNWPRPLDFPVAENDDDMSFHTWRDLQAFCATWRSMPGATVTAFEFAAALTTPTPTPIESLVRMAGWDDVDLFALATHFGWTDPDGSHSAGALSAALRSAANLRRAADCVALLRRLGVAAERAIGWARDTRLTGAGKRTADELRHVASGRYDTSQWYQILTPIQDDLREAKRRVLVNKIISVASDFGDPMCDVIHDVESLYGWFLLDVEMSACMLTSRLLQAIASVQLFVQRCMLGLEPEVRVDSEADPRWLQWQWLKNYRVWEANRKVFLYPENWLEPELRDEKSPPFLELEQELLQGDVTADTVEQACANYLTKLDSVANLEIRTTVREHLDPTTSTLHVVGRARSAGGGDHYYRRQVNYGRWTPWERIDLDIGDDHLVALVQDHRLHLLWPQVLEKSSAPRTVSAPQPGASTTMKQPYKDYEIRLFSSERRHERWSPKELVGDVAFIPGFALAGNVHNLSMHVAEHDGLIIEMATTANAAANASSSFTFFRKAGRQVTMGRYGSGGYDYFPPPRGRFVDNVIRHDSQLLFGMIKRPRGADGATPLSQYGAKSIYVLANLPSGTGYTVLDSDANNPDETGTFFYFDWRRTYFVTYHSNPLYSSTKSNGSGHPLLTGTEWVFTFLPHYHPFVDAFSSQLSRQGLRGLFDRRVQLDPAALPGVTAFDFSTYEPVHREDAANAIDDSTAQSHVTEDDPVEGVDFDYTGAYASYNWELFFHLPALIAAKLSANQKFEDALQWLHFIFDPTGGEGPTSDPSVVAPEPQQRFWITKPFYLRSSAEYQASRIAAILDGISAHDPQLVAQLDEWRNNPFSPHLIARMRTVAYQKNVVMKYVQTLVAWGDGLFAQDTMETINEATQLYALAAAILGRRPRRTPSTARRAVRTYDELEKLGLLRADPLVEAENILPPASVGATVSPSTPMLPVLNLPYFTLPNNEKLLGMWDLVEDRLFKIRHCMNLAGTVRDIPLFSAPIDPALLVKATAAGLSVADALADIGAPLPRQRFTTGIGHARAAVDEVKTLGSALASALEKRDAEALAIVRQDLEHQARTYVLAVRNDQITEAQRNVESLTEQRKTTEARLAHYSEVIDGGWNDREKEALALVERAMALETGATVVSAIAGAMAVIPDFDAGATGAFGSPTAKIKFGGSHLSGALAMTVGLLRGLGSLAQMGAGRLTTIAGYGRREQDWALQRTLAEKELAQIDKQIVAAQIREQIARKELENQKLQIANNEAETSYLQRKFTNTQLYDWMVGQCSLVYFQTFQLALDLAKRAERSYRFELGVNDSSYVKGPHWDSLYKGLFAGERLSYDLRRLEAAFHDQNEREYELSKHISLSQLDPVELLRLKRSGTCTFTVPEAAYDLDHPGHYFRRLKTVSLSVPCVVGPYATVGAQLKLVSATIRVSAALKGADGESDRYGHRADDDRFADQLGVVNAIATSSAQQDDGLFALDFSDARYLPFEGAGAISTWQLQINDDPAQFDLDTITDVIVHTSYTARDGGEVFAKAARDYVKKVLAGAPAAGDRAKMLFRVLDLRREYADQWQRFQQAPPDSGHEAAMALGDLTVRLPYLTQGKTKTVHHLEVAGLATGAGDFSATITGLGDPITLPLTSTSPYDGLLSGSRDVAPTALGPLAVQVTPAAKGFDELFVIIGYTIS